MVPLALAAVRKGGRVVCAGIHMSQIPAFSYDLLWGEREICSVANLTRRDGGGEIESMRDAGGYLGYRVGVASDGRWLFAVAGD